MNDCGAFKYVARFANILCINHIHCIYFPYSAETFQYNIISNVIFDFILTWRKLSFSCDFFFFNDVVLSKGSINLCYSVGSPFRHLLLVIIFLSIYIFATLLLIRTNIASTKCILYLLTSILWSRNRSDIFEHIPWFCTPFRGNNKDTRRK